MYIIVLGPGPDLGQGRLLPPPPPPLPHQKAKGPPPNGASLPPPPPRLAAHIAPQYINISCPGAPTGDLAESVFLQKVELCDRLVD